MFHPYLIFGPPIINLTSKMVGLMFLMPSTHKNETKTIKGGKLLIANQFDQSINIDNQ